MVEETKTLPELETPTYTGLNQKAKLSMTIKRILKGGLSLGISIIAMGIFDEEWLLALGPVLLGIDKYLNEQFPNFWRT